MTLLAGRYRLGDTLGSGGMARVHEATDEVLGRRVAVKVLAAEVADEDLRGRFLREAGAAASFTHPNVVEIYDVGADNGALFIVMELIDGDTLATLLSDRGRLAEAEALDIMRPVLSALGGAHTAGVVHRDVKPGNILISADGTVKLVDFGIARTMSDIETELTGADTIVGTVRYMSPEQTMGHPATPASDIYAAGVMLFEMLTGSAPFTGETSTAVAMAHQQQPVPAARDIDPEISGPVDQAIRRAMAKDPEDRFATAAEMQQALALASPTRTMVMPAVASPSPPQPQPRPHRARRDPARRQQLGWLVAGLVIGALLATVPLLLAGSTPAALPTTTDGSAGADATEDPATTTTGDEDTTTTTEDTTTTTEPRDALDEAETIGALTDILAPDPRAWGQRGMDLLEGLHEVQEQLGRNPRNEAQDLISDIEEWLERGQIDERMANRTIEIIAPFAR